MRHVFFQATAKYRESIAQITCEFQGLKRVSQFTQLKFHSSGKRCCGYVDAGACRRWRRWSLARPAPRVHTARVQSVPATTSRHGAAVSRSAVPCGAVYTFIQQYYAAVLVSATTVLQRYADNQTGSGGGVGWCCSHARTAVCRVTNQ